MAVKWPSKRRLIGTKIARIDGADKATGKAKYSYDINRPGMLHAVMLRCPHPHAKIKAIDAIAKDLNTSSPVGPKKDRRNVQLAITQERENFAAGVKDADVTVEGT